MTATSAVGRLLRVGRDRRRRGILLLLGTLATAAPACAEDLHGPDVFASVGTWASGSAASVDLGVGYSLGPAFRASVDYEHGGSDRHGIQGVDRLTGLVSLTYWHVYVLGGGGLYRYGYDSGFHEQGTSLVLGFGLSVRLKSHLTLFGEWRADLDSYSDGSTGIKGIADSVRAGGRYSF